MIKIPEEITAGVMIKLNDNIAEKDIVDLELNKDIVDDLDALSKKCLVDVDDKFLDRINLNGGGFIVAGDNFFDGDNKAKIAALLEKLNIKSIVAKSFADDVKDELVKVGILPFEFADIYEYHEVGLYDILKFTNLIEDLPKGIVEVINITKGTSFFVKIK